MAVLGLLVPVAMGGATVFGVYFFFLKDRLKRPPIQTAAEPESEAAKPEPEKRDELDVRPPQPTFVPKPKPAADGVTSLPDPAPMKTAVQEAITPADREKAAENALGLARKMLDTRPRAAPDWFQRVVDRFPGTKAAGDAQTWLKQHAAEP